MLLRAWLLCVGVMMAWVSGGSGQPTESYLAQTHSCTSDAQCSAGLYCHAHRHAHKHAHFQCSPCRRRGRRCYRDQMCCPGNHCQKNVCTKHTKQVRAGHSGGQSGRAFTKQHIAEAGARCLRSSDCVLGHCCVRHMWVRLCRAEPREGDVCSTPKLRKGRARVELFQRCPCSNGLHCKPHTHTPAHTHHPAAARLHTCQRM